MNKINIIGAGPGNPEYILPIAKKIIDSSDAVFIARRNIECFELKDKKVFVMESDFIKISDYIKANKNSEKISVVVSGDPLFFSLLAFLKKHFSIEELNIIPGISVMQYFFSRIGLSYEEAKFISLHGRENDIAETVRNNSLVFILTDNKNSPQKIADILIKKNIIDKIAYIGSNLSYNNEVVIKDSISKIIEYKNSFELSVMVISDE
jgi:cobalt-precorrin-7 (C5)-methyltransferase